MIIKWIHRFITVIMAAYFLVYAIPQSYWYKLETVNFLSIYDTDVEITLDVVRTIKRPFWGIWRVDIQKLDGNVFKSTCHASNKHLGGQKYDPNNELPNPLYLSWWASEECSDPDDGVYRIETCHTVVLPIVPNKTRCVMSNTFRVGNVGQQLLPLEQKIERKLENYLP